MVQVSVREERRCRIVPNRGVADDLGDGGRKEVYMCGPLMNAGEPSNQEWTYQSVI
jgi:hypothetical protein